MEVLGQVYRERSQGLRLLAIRITNAGDDLGMPWSYNPNTETDSVDGKTLRLLAAW